MEARRKNPFQFGIAALLAVTTMAAIAVWLGIILHGAARILFGCAGLALSMILVQTTLLWATGRMDR